MQSSTQAPLLATPAMSLPGATMAASIVILLVIPFFTHLNPFAAAALATMALLMAQLRQRQLTAALLSLSTFAWLCTIEIGWPWPCVGAALTYAALSQALRLPQAWRRLGLPSRRVALCVAACVVVSTAVILTWTALAHPDVAVFRRRLPQDAGWPTILALAALFSCINAAGEELMYRGVLMDALRQAWGRTPLAVAGQALAFGAIHWHGFPYGWWGVVLATGYGSMMAGLRLLSGGIAASWAAHVLADVLIVIVVALI